MNNVNHCSLYCLFLLQFCFVFVYQTLFLFNLILLPSNIIITMILFVKIFVTLHALAYVKFSE